MVSNRFRGALADVRVWDRCLSADEADLVATPETIADILALVPAKRSPQQARKLRAYFLEGHPSHEVARAFGYSPGSFRVLCHQFRRDPNPEFFVLSKRGPREQPKKAKAHDLAVALRKQNHSVYEIAAALKERNLALSPTAVREVLRAEGFAPSFTSG